MCSSYNKKGALISNTFIHKGRNSIGACNKMKKLTVYLKNYKAHLIFGPFFKLLEAIFELIVPLVMADIIDMGVSGSAGVDYILSRGGIILALGVVGLGCALICQYVASKCSQGYGTLLRNDLFKHINLFSYKELDKFGTASLVNRLTADVNQLQHIVAMVIRIFIRAPFLVIGAIVMAMIINLKLSLIFIVAAPIIAIALYFIMSRTIPKYKVVQAKLDHITDITKENLDGARVIRAFANQKYETERFDKATDDLNRISLRVGAISALLNPITFAVVNLAILAILYFGGVETYNGNITQGEIIAFVNYMTQISLALVIMAQVIILITKSAASASRILEVLNTSPSITDDGNEEVALDTNSPAVAFNNVSFGYSDADKAIEHLDIKIPSGSTIGIIGGTGSGKSTLVNLIGRFYDVTDGDVQVFGSDVKKYPLKQLRSLVSYVPQQAVLASGTIRSNMQWGKHDATDEEIWAALDTAQASSFVSQHEEGLDTIVERNGRNFSGGQRQRLTIARALVSQPKILVLDDSSSALDFATDYKLRKALAETKGDTTLFIVSQRTSSIKNTDIIIVLDEGNVVGIGTHSDLLDTCEVYKEICLSQKSKEESNNENL